MGALLLSVVTLCSDLHPDRSSKLWDCVPLREGELRNDVTELSAPLGRSAYEERRPGHCACQTVRPSCPSAGHADP